MKTLTIVRNLEEQEAILIEDSTWEIQELEVGHANLYLAYNGTSKLYATLETSLQDAYDSFADSSVFDTQGPLSKEEEEELWKEFPVDGPGAAGYFSAGNAGEYFNGCYLRVDEYENAKVETKIRI